jgi:hypothetical protein
MAGLVVDNRGMVRVVSDYFKECVLEFSMRRCIQLALALDSNDFARLNGFSMCARQTDTVGAYNAANASGQISEREAQEENI